MNDVKRALTRRLGPLPAYVWAAIGGVGLFLYRRRTDVSGAAPAALSPDVYDSTTGLRDPVVLQPGERVFDPSSGAVFGGSDGGSSGSGDGATGSTGGDGAGGTGGGDNPGGAVGGVGDQRTPKPTIRHAHAAKGPSVSVLRKRMRAAVRTKRAKPAAKGHPARQAPKQSKPRGKVSQSATEPAAPGRGRATSPAPVALRQRPLPPRLVDHAEQRVLKAAPVRAATTAGRSPAPLRQAKAAGPAKSRARRV